MDSARESANQRLLPSQEREIKCAISSGDCVQFQPVVTPRVLEYNWGGGDVRWELEAVGSGTRLTLWANIDRRFIAMGAAGWHICLDVLDHLLGGAPIGRRVGVAVMKFPGWQRLNAEYAKEFGVESPSW